MTSRAPGRPRSEQSRGAILDAALDLAGEVGYRNLTIEGIAARAGVGKQTIYRWWPTKADVLLEAGAALADVRVPTDDRGSYAADLRTFLVASYALANKPAMAALLRALMAEAQLDQQFAARFRSAFLQRRRDALGELIRRADRRGDRPRSPSAEVVADIVFGTIWYRVLATGRRLDRSFVDDLVATLTGR